LAVAAVLAAMSAPIAVAQQQKPHDHHDLATKATNPVGIRFGKVFPIGKQPVNLFL
jgi:hypothetical protein